MSLTVEQLSAGYGNIGVLRDLSFSLEKGEVLGVLGRNGMGKTTLIRALAGTIPTARGAIVLDGEDITALPDYQRARRGITTIVQGRGMFPKLTVRENLEMGRIAGGRAKRDRRDEVLSYFPRLAERLNQLAGTMSGGEQQMLAIGRGLMTDPKIMLLDEPSDGIMPTLVRQIAETLARINREEGMTIIIVEQNVPMVFGMAHRCIILEKGRIVAGGTKDDIAESNLIREYLAI
ncbi:ABC transporter ATP-binding protein [Rhodoligotrophos defluvii]|uniref:ABC transporter ATP-binding protein n=1 Tax=Rhodoligotrophos defluvii TaxID=2561934 RepID=UPI001EF0BF49|nr:ABC transporter ATP-binding protein [Rhodoligotrophos defluvii]